MNFKEPGKYRITASFAAVSSDALAVLEVAGRTAEIKPAATGSWDKFSEIEAGTIEVSQAGEQKVKVSAARRPELEAHQPAMGEA